MWVAVVSFALGIGTALADVPAKGSSTDGSDWPRWRGPDADGISKDTHWNPAALKDAKPVWKVNVGEGFSGVSVKGRHVFTMGFKAGKDIVCCLDAGTGAEVWKQSYVCGRGDQHFGPRCTPTLDGGFVYTLSREGHILCMKESDGSIVWQKNAMSDFQAKNLTWGLTASPCVEGDLLVLNAGLHGLALNKKTGEKVWSSGAEVGSYAAPVFYTLGGKRCAAIFGEKAIYGVDVKTGQALWSHSWETSYNVNAADPIVSGNDIFFTSGYGRGCALLDIAGPNPRLIYENKILCGHFSTPVLMGGHLYGLTGNTGNGDLVCMDFKTGALNWKKNLGFGSLTAVGDRLIVLNEHGQLFIVEASPAGYKEVVSGPSGLGGVCWTAPVFCRGMIYCRDKTGDLVALDVSK